MSIFKPSLGKVRSSIMSEKDLKALRSDLSKQMINAGDGVDMLSILPKKEIVNSCGCDIKGVAMTFYSRPFSNNNNNIPIAFRVSRTEVAPSVFFVAQNPTLFPFVVIGDHVGYKRLKQGAHVMARGVVTKYSSPIGVAKGSVCAVVCIPSCTVVAVGVADMSLSEMASPAANGRGVTVLHTLFDALVTGVCQPSFEAAKNVAFTGFAAVSSSELEEFDDDQEEEGEEGIEEGEEEENVAEAAPPPVVLAAPDAVSFLLEGLLRIKKSEFPILFNLAIGKYVTPIVDEYNRSLNSDDESETATIKIKASKHLAPLRESGVVVASETTPGVLSLTAVHHDAPVARDHKKAVRDGLLPPCFDKASAGADSTTTTTTASSAAAAPGGTLKIAEIVQEYRTPRRWAHGAVLPTREDSDNAYSAKEITTIVADYIKTNSLGEGENCKLDNDLIAACGYSTLSLKYDPKDGWARAKRKDVVTKIIDKLCEQHTLVFVNGAKETRNGTAKSVTIDLVQRCGNKVVTRVRGLKMLRTCVDFSEMCHTLQHQCASHCSVQRDDEDDVEIIILGPKVPDVENYLVDVVGLPRSCIVASANSIKKKGGKK
eukprot:PhM_4_TR11233/c0_g1_i1/m.74066/K15027/EIF2D; translation initiation factor 2D